MEKIQFSIEAYNTGKYDVVTRDGRPVEIKFTDGRGKCPIVAYIDQMEYPEYFTTSGEHHMLNAQLLLVEKEKTESWYFNQYGCETGRMYLSMEDCLYSVPSSILICVTKVTISSRRLPEYEVVHVYGKGEEND